MGSEGKTWGRDSYEGVFSRKYLQGRIQVLASKMSQTVTEIVSPILDKRKGRKDSLHTGHYSPQEISAEPVYNQNARKSQIGRAHV